MFRKDREAHFLGLLDDPLIQALMKADHVDALKLEAMLLRIANDLKSRNRVPSSSSRLGRMSDFLKAY